MSRESIPAFDCKECDKYKTCTSLCAAAKMYANQDYKGQREKPIGLPRRKAIEYQKLTKSNEEKIIELYFIKHLKQIQIAEIIHVSPPFISKIIKKYSIIIAEKLKI